MNIKPFYAIIKPICICYFVIFICLKLINTWFISKGIKGNVLIMGNLVIFFVTFLSLFMLTRKRIFTNAYAFVQAIYGSVFVKMIVCSVAVFTYIYNTTKPNTPAILLLMPIYLVYLALEVMAFLKLQKQLKSNTNA